MDDLQQPRSHDFNLYLAAEALKGITEAIFEMLAEIPTDETDYAKWVSSLNGLCWAGMRIARETQHFLEIATDQHRIPMDFSSLKPH